PRPNMNAVNVLAPLDRLGCLARSRMCLALLENESGVVILNESAGEPRFSGVHPVYGYASQQKRIQHWFAGEHVAVSFIGRGLQRLRRLNRSMDGHRGGAPTPTQRLSPPPKGLCRWVIWM